MVGEWSGNGRGMFNAGKNTSPDPAAQGLTSEDTMLARRLCVYSMWEKLPVQAGEYVQECASCFAGMLYHYAS